MAEPVPPAPGETPFANPFAGSPPEAAPPERDAEAQRLLNEQSTEAARQALIGLEDRILGADRSPENTMLLGEAIDALGNERDRMRQQHIKIDPDICGNELDDVIRRGIDRYVVDDPDTLEWLKDRGKLDLSDPDNPRPADVPPDIWDAWPDDVKESRLDQAVMAQRVADLHDAVTERKKAIADRNAPPAPAASAPAPIVMAPPVVSAPPAPRPNPLDYLLAASDETAERLADQTPEETKLAWESTQEELANLRTILADEHATPEDVDEQLGRLYMAYKNVRLTQSQISRMPLDEYRRLEEINGLYDSGLERYVLPDDTHTSFSNDVTTYSGYMRFVAWTAANPSKKPFEYPHSGTPLTLKPSAKERAFWQSKLHEAQEALRLDKRATSLLDDPSVPWITNFRRPRSRR